MRLAGRVAMVTGAASGIGEAVSHLFAREGASILACDWDRERLEKLRAALAGEGRAARCEALDVSKSAEVRRAVEAGLGAFGHIDILVNNAGISPKKPFLDYIFLEPNEIRETGEYDLEGLFVRLQYAVETIGAKRVLLDTLEALFSGFSNPAILRSEVRRLFRWLKEKGLTTVVTAEQGDGTLTRQGLEEYVSDCVILLDDRIQDQVSTRRMRIVKYRGSSHGADEYPFLIDEHGISVLPVTTLGLNHAISDERVSTGVADLDAMMEGKGYYRGSSVLVSGTAVCTIFSA